MLSRLWEAEQPRAVLVGWDTYEVADLPAQGVRALPERPRVRGVAARAAAADAAARRRDGFANAKERGYEADDFLGAAVASEEKRGGDGARRDLRPRPLPARERATTILQPVRGVSELARIGPAEVRRALRRRAGAGAGLHRAARRPVRQAPRRARRRAEEGRRRPAANTARWRPRSRPAASPPRRRICGSTVESPRWTPPPHSLPSIDQIPTWAEASSLAEDWGLNGLAERLAKFGLMDAWLQDARDSLAETAGLPPDRARALGRGRCDLARPRPDRGPRLRRADERAAALLPRRPRPRRRRPRHPRGRGPTDLVSHPTLAQLHPTEPHVESRERLLVLLDAFEVVEGSAGLA